MNPKLIVLIPHNIDTSRIPHRIRQLANAANMQVLLLGLGGNNETESSLRRGMVTLAAVLLNEKVVTDIKIENATGWVEAVDMHYQPGDIIVCSTQPQAGIFRRSLAEILTAELRVPIYFLSDQPSRDLAPAWKTELKAWTGLVGLLLAFGLLQLKVVHLTHGGLQTILLVLSTILEFWLFGVWSNLVC